MSIMFVCRLRMSFSVDIGKMWSEFTCSDFGQASLTQTPSPVTVDRTIISSWKIQ